LSGVFIWELGAGVLSNSGSQPLINSIKSAIKDSITIPAIPQLFSPLNKSQGIFDSVTLSWFPVEFADSYRIQLAGDSLFTGILLDSTISNSTSVLIHNINTPQKYFWHVCAINDSGKSEFTSTREFSTAEAQLNYPLLIIPPNNSKKVSNNVTFKWSQITDAGSYELQIANSPNICDLVLDTIIVNDTSFIKQGLEYSKAFYWRLRSIPKKNSTLAAGNFSEWFSFTTIGSPPSVPVLSSPTDDVKNISVNTVLRWKASSYAEKYEVRISTDSSFTQIVIDTTGIVNTYLQIKNMSPAATYYWSVIAFNEDGSSGWSETRKFTIAGSNDKLSQIDGEAVEFELFQNYPNPFNANTVIRFGLPDECNVQIIITDILGKYKNVVQELRLDAGIYEIQLNGLGLASGVYFYTIVAGVIDQAAEQKVYMQTKKMIMIK